MIDFTNSIFINALQVQVFNFVSHLENIPLWNYYVKNVTKITKDINGVGARYHQIRRKDEQIFEITGYQPHKLLEIKTLPESSLQFKRRITFEEKETGTIIHDYFQLNTNHISFIEKIFSQKAKKGVMDNLKKLKELLETGQVTLQDGRTIEIN